MQKIWKICRAPHLGLSFILLLLFFIISTPSLRAKCIWENSQTGENFEFKGLDKVFVFEALNSNVTEKELKAALKSAINKKGEIRIINNLETQTIGALGESNLFLNVFLVKSENENINSLRVFASTSAEATHNHAHILANVWEKNYIFENKKDLNKDISEAIKKSIDLFVAQYFQTNLQTAEKIVFYYPQAKNAEIESKEPANSMDSVKKDRVLRIP